MQPRIRVLIAFVALVLTPAAMAQDDAVSVSPASFENAGATLAGSLYLPVGAAPTVGVVIVHGSGPEPRMDALARLFAGRGMAVVSYDKRGVGESGGHYEDLYNISPENLALLSGDAAAAMDWLAAQPGIGHLPLGYWGISQGGWIVPDAAVQTPETDFLTLWSGPVSTVSEELEDGLTKDGNIGDPALVRAYIDELRAAGTDPDPREALSRLSIPGLWIYGSADTNVPVRLSMERLQGLIDAGHTEYETRLNEGGGHDIDFSRDADRVMFRGMIEWMLARENQN